MVNPLPLSWLHSNVACYGWLPLLHGPIVFHRFARMTAEMYDARLFGMALMLVSVNVSTPDG
jgi:hypothetical protein